MNHIRNELSRFLRECGVDMTIAEQIPNHIPDSLVHVFFDQLSKSRIVCIDAEEEIDDLEQRLSDAEEHIGYMKGTYENLEYRLIDMTRKYKECKSELESLSKKQSLDTSTHHP